MTLMTAALVLACNSFYLFRNDYNSANALLHHTDSLREKPFLKAHYKDGRVCILRDSWSVDTAVGVITGNGIVYDFNREQIFEGAIRVAVDSLAIFETNSRLPDHHSSRVAKLGLLAGVDVIVGLICLTNPKACFGSCPTFYFDPNTNFHYAEAEGFSSAIAPSLAYTDIDALYQKKLPDGKCSLFMKNEAQETHCVRDLKLLGITCQAGERVYHTRADRFYRCRGVKRPSTAIGPEGDITHLLCRDDLVERFSLTDSFNLASKESIELTFRQGAQPDPQGLILHFRQTLLTTYLIYEALACMGDEASDLIARMEISGDGTNPAEKLYQALGAIEVFQWDSKEGNWQAVGELYETGPIAINRQLVPLRRTQGSDIRVKLRMNKGLWRLDYCALTSIVREVHPKEFTPVAMTRGKTPDPAGLKFLTEQKEPVVTFPGEVCRFDFELPASEIPYELFLSSNGYYLEWMRASWFREKNPVRLHKMLEDPDRFLRESAADYKRYEAEMEKEFWESRIQTLADHAR